MLRKRTLFLVLSVALLGAPLAGVSHAQEPGLAEAQAPSYDYSVSHKALVYFAGERAMEPLYESTLQGLSEARALVVYETDDPVLFEEQLNSGEYEVMVALTSDTAQTDAWYSAATEVPTFATCTPSDDGDYELAFRFNTDDASEPPAYEPAGDASISHTAPAEPDDDVACSEDMAIGLPSIEEVWAKIQAFAKDARQWISDKMKQIAAILREMGEDIEVEATVHVGEPTGSLWLELKVKGNGAAVATFLEKVGAVVEPSKEKKK